MQYTTWYSVADHAGVREACRRKLRARAVEILLYLEVLESILSSEWQAHKFEFNCRRSTRWYHLSKFWWFFIPWIRSWLLHYESRSERRKLIFVNISEFKKPLWWSIFIIDEKLHIFKCPGPIIDRGWRTISKTVCSFLARK